MATTGTPLGNMVIQLSMDGTQFSNTLQGIKREIRVAQTAMKANLEILSNAGDEYALLENKIKDLTQIMDANKRKIDELRRQHQNAIQTYGEGSKQVQLLASQINSAITRQAAWERQLRTTEGRLEDLKSGTADLRQEISNITRATQENVASLNASGRVYSAQRARIDGLSQTVNRYNNLIEAQRQRINNLSNTFGENDSRVEAARQELQRYTEQQQRAQERLDQLRNRFDRLSPSVGELSDNLGQVSSRMREVSDRARKTGEKIHDIGSNIKESVVPMTGALTLGLGFATKSAMDFESQMSAVKSVMAPDEVNKYGKALEELAVIQGAKTKYSALEAAQAEEELVKAGVSVKDIINGGLSGALSLATAGGLELKDAAEIASTALNAFRDDNISVADAANILAGAANASATDVGELKYGLSMVSAVASGVGLSFRDTSTALAAFAQNGLKGSDAGTSLKTMLLNLSPHTKAASDMMDSLGLATANTKVAYQWLVDRGIKPASTEFKDVSAAVQKLAKIQAGHGASAAKVAKEYDKLATYSGLASSAFYDENGNLKSISEIAALLKDRLKDLSNEQRQQALNTMFGTDAIRAANILYKEGAKGMDDMAAAIGKISADDVAKTKLDNLKGTIEQLKGSVETAGITIGQNLTPALKVVATVIQKVVDVFNALPSPVQHFLVIGAALVAVLGLIATAIGFTMIGIGGAIKGFGEFGAIVASATRKIAESEAIMATLGSVMNFALGPIGLAIAAISTLGIAFAVAYQKSETFRNFINGIGASIGTAFSKVKQAVSGIFALFKGDQSKGKSLLSSLMPPEMVKVIVDSVNKIKSAFYNMTAPLTSAYGKVKTVITGIFALFSGNTKKGTSILSGVLSAKDISSIRSMVAQVRQVIMSVITYIKAKTTEIRAFWQQNGPMITKAFVNIFSGIVKTVTTVMTTIFQIVGPILKSLVALFKVLLPPISVVFKLVFTVALALIKSVLNNIKGVIDGTLNIIMGIAKVFGGLFTGNWKKMWEGIKQLFFGAFQLIWNAIQLMWFGKMIKGAALFIGSFKALFVGLWNILKSVFKTPIKWIVNFLKDNFNIMKRTASTVFGGIKTVISKVWGGIKLVFTTVIKYIVKFLKLEFNGMKVIVTTIFKVISKVISTTWSVIKKIFVTTAKFLYNTVRTRFGNIKDFIGKVFSWIWNFAKKAWSGISNVIIKPVVNVFKTVVKYFTNIKQNALKIFDGLKKGAQNIWTKMVDGIKSLPRRMGDGLKNGAKAIGKGAKAVAKILIEGLAKGVNGVTGGVNWILDKVHAPKKLRIPKWDVPKYARGTDNHPGGPAIVSDGKGPNKQELIALPNGQMFLSPKKETMLNLPKGTSVLDGNKTAALLKMAPKYSTGIGWLDSAWDKTKEFASSAASKVTNAAKDIWSYATHPTKLLEMAISKFTKLDALKDPTLGMVKGAVTSVKDGAVNWIKGLLTADNPPGKGVQRWKPLVKRALEMNGLSTSTEMVNKVLRQIQTESGGDPKAVQHGYTDINTIRGDLAKGLMQTISSTFNAYKFKGHDNIFNGFDNLLAALNYAKHRYGPTLSALGQGHGYANGGIVTRAQVANIAEGNKPESIIPLDPLKRTRALQLLSKTQQILGVPNGSQVTVNNDYSEVIARQDAQITLMQQQITLLTQLLAKDNSLYLDGKEVYNTNKKYADQKTKLRNLAKGVVTT
ncbi:phage tail tape measure protein [Bacillus subtilis]|uniref:phage tail tape measure protein n=1 Tax=Bacillus subtilis TaxID=1423 RepID=UPI000BA57420|nr:phage tail tape measure protein [Bacillus subtilis]MBW9317271.1 phage tail tape measure protein [Bacillus subtilis]MDK8210123.1 phage tail tape measure protein [Bacillus subtilis]MEC2389748.1 phage tail tape measure protein [Bacillus subtilis]MED2688304.1 phage tail tape measure protein [Bacillus subtilis]MED4522529.1 phage tail tape measure protein [Bacillus subtilis]